MKVFQSINNENLRVGEKTQKKQIKPQRLEAVSSFANKLVLGRGKAFDLTWSTRLYRKCIQVIARNWWQFSIILFLIIWYL